MGKYHDALTRVGELKKISTVAANRPIAPAASPPSQHDQPKKYNLDVHRDESSILDPTLVTFHDPHCVEAEIFKILRTNILFPKEGTPPRSIMITSAIPGDGKSFVASNLAISIAQGIEEHVLLLDCDMRRSTIHRRFGIEDKVGGLSDYLMHKQPLSALLRKTVVDKLTILPGGKSPANPADLISSQAMKNLLEETKSRYTDRYVIVDSPPPQLTAETTALANYIDAIIIVVKYGSTPREMVKDLCDRLGREKVIGVVMNGYRVPATERYGYGRYNRYEMKY